MRFLVCGGRDFLDKEFAFLTLDRLHAQRGIGLIIQGGASGADYLGHRWAEERHLASVEYSADWNTHGRAAGPLRNARMIAEGKPDIVIAFKGGRGTADMIRKAEAAGIEAVRPLPASLPASCQKTGR